MPKFYKPTSNKSLYESYLTGSHTNLLGDHAILNSNGASYEVKVNNTRKLSFTHIIKGTEIKANHELAILEKIPTEEELIRWIEQFRETAAECEWNEATQVAVLKQLMKDEPKETIKRKTTAESILSCLTEEVFPKRNKINHLRKLEKTFQNQFLRISDYYLQIVLNTKKLALCENISTGDQQKKIDDTFLSNLSQNTRIKMNELGLATRPEILKNIKSTEEILLESRSSNSTITPKKDESTQFCKRHNTSKHSGEECATKLKQAEKKETPPVSKKSVQRIIPNRRDESLLKATVGENEANILIDSGSTVNLIHPSLLSSSTIITKLDNPLKVRFANKHEETLSKTVKISFKLASGGRTKEFTTTFYVFKNNDNEMILGVSWLKEVSAKICYKSNAIKIEKERFKFLNIENSVKDFKSYSPNKILKKIKTLVKDFKDKEIINGHIKNVKHEISILEGKSVRKNEYPVPIAQREPLKLHLNELIKDKIIKKSKSSFSSPAFTLIKKDGSIRLIGDFRELNTITIDDHFPYPEIHNTFIDLDKSVIFSQLDLKKGFYQIEIEPEDTHKTAFSVMGNKYEYLRMPFGLKNAPFVFQRAMVNILGDLDYVKIFVDDILIFSKSEKDHYKHLKRVLNRLERNKIAVNFDKSLFAKPEVPYLGQVINKDGVRADTKPLEKLTNLQKPKTRKELMRLIGTIQWFRPYIKDLSSKMTELTQLLHKDSKFEWKESHKLAYEKLKDDVKQNIRLSFPKIGKTFRLETDASDHGLGAVLTQEHGIIGFYSKKLTDVESRYSIVEKEFLSITKALKHFRKIVLGGKIEIFTDNKNLTHYHKIDSNRISRWSWNINEYNFTIQHIAGKENVIADSLSREHCSRIATEKDKKSGKNIIVELYSNKKTPKKEEIGTIHSYLGHPSDNRLYKYLRKLNVEIKRKEITSSKECITCHQVKHDHTKKPRSEGNLNRVIRNETVGTDICGPYTITDSKGEIKSIQIISFICLCTRYTVSKIIKEATTSSVIKAFNKSWKPKFGNPKTLLTDRGKQFTSNNFVNFCNENEIKLIHSTANNARGNSKVERIHKQINEILRYLKTGVKYKELEELIERRLNSLENRSTGESPHYLMKKYEFGAEDEDLNFEDRFALAMERSNKSAVINQEKENAKTRIVMPIVGSKIFVKNKTSKKQDLLYNGPYLVSRTENNWIEYQDNKLKLKRTSIRNIKAFDV